MRRYATEAGYAVEREVSAADLLVQNLGDGDIGRLIPGARADERRMDIVLKDPNAGEEIWVDVTVRHPTCDHYLRAHGDPTAASVRALKEAVDRKNRTYGGLLRAAQMEAEDHQRVNAPSFHVAALTTLGQFGEQFDTLIEKIVRHRSEFNDGPRMDGKSPQRVTQEFRQNFKMDLIIAMARGNAFMITRAGRSRSFLRGRWVRV